MRTMGFLISHKNHEGRRALLPEHLEKIRNANHLFFEEGYGYTVGYDDAEYAKRGANIVSRSEVLKCDIITDVKLGDADYLSQLADNKILFGWAHAVQGIKFTDCALKKNFTVIAWEEIFEDGRYIFYRNREVAGEAGVLQAFLYCGKMPYDCKVAIIGNGQTAKGALRVLHGLGATVDVYGRKYEKLFKKKMYDYDVIINCVMWDTSREDRLIYKSDLKKMKRGTMIIDISCDPGLEIETSFPTSIDNPVYSVDGIIHYSVDNTPALFPYTVTKVLSENCCRYIDQLIENNYSDEIKKAIVIENGQILDKRIIDFRKKRNLFIK